MLEKKDFEKIGKVMGEKIFSIEKNLKEEIKKEVEDLAVMTKKGFDEVGKRFDKMDKEVVKIRATMVTKSYLDDKMADLRGDTVAIQRKEDEKLNRLIEFLHKKKILAPHEVESLEEIRVFPLPPKIS